MSVGVGASAISKGKYATDESLQDAVTATSGSGPAYFFRFVEAMIAGAQDLGLSESDARTLVIQTITGAAAMLNQEGADPGVLRQNVTSPNGTTYAALQVFEGGDLEGLIKRAMKAARDRSQELS
jgi:pyrroline-5-carboxylate reductase